MKSLEAKSLVLLQHHLKVLRLPTVASSARRWRPAAPPTTSTT